VLPISSSEHVSWVLNILGQEYQKAQLSEPNLLMLPIWLQVPEAEMVLTVLPFVPVSKFSKELM
jgi:hypothetical protein